MIGTTDTLPFSGDPRADPDNNAWSNPVECAPGPNPQITHALTPAGFTVTIPRVSSAGDTIISGGISTTLTGWTAAELSSSTPDSLTYRIPAALTPEGRVFIRAPRAAQAVSAGKANRRQP